MTPGVFALPAGCDFAAEFAAGLRDRLPPGDPLAPARLRLWANSRRTAAALSRALAAALGPDALLPRIAAVTDLAEDPAAPPLPPAIPALRRELRLARLVGALLDRRPDLAPRSARFELAASLAALLDELQGAGIPPGAMKGLVPPDHAAHWETSLAFLAIIGEAWPRHLAEAEGGALDPEARQRRAVEALAAAWAADPPADPVIVAGSTGSRPATRALMEAVARLPRGIVVLPGLDPDLPPEALADIAADHPQATLASFLAGLGRTPAEVPGWTAAHRPTPRTRLLSLALRPAPVTDLWRAEVPALAPQLAEATAGLTLVEAETEAEEALAIALALREGAENPGRAALVTPDRTLARRVAAALARWEIRPDDAAGRPLALTPPGVFLRLLARLPDGEVPADRLVGLLKHPLAGGAGEVRRTHRLAVSRLERSLRRAALPALGPDWFARWAARRGDPATAAWAAWLADCLAGPGAPGPLPLADRLRRLRTLAERLCDGPAPGGLRLWERADGAAARDLMDRLAAEAEGAGIDLSAPDLARLLEAQMAAVNVPPADPAEAPDPRITILGNREARIGPAGRILLGGLAEGAWPAPPPADPWLSRPMRAALGLAPPERRIGLSAHDFWCAAAGPEVILTRAKRTGGAPALASRWLIRLENLLLGAGEEGKATLAAMRARGDRWLGLARALDRPAAEVPRAPRPAPRPPVSARPRRLSATRIGTLIRDPYAIYAETVLGLRRLDPLARPPDARDRGTVLHAILARFAAEVPGPLPADARDRLLAIAGQEIAARVPWPAERRLWLARLARAADWFLATEAGLRAAGETLAHEVRGELVLVLPAGPFHLTARADRIDRQAAGLAVIDYKTGTPPSPKQENAFDRQLWVEAAIAEKGGFEGLPAAPVASMRYLGLTGTGEGGKERLIEPPEGAVAGNLARLRTLLARYDDPETPYPSRLRPTFLHDGGDYDHLARAGEWEPGEGEEEEAPE